MKKLALTFTVLLLSFISLSVQAADKQETYWNDDKYTFISVDKKSMFTNLIKNGKQDTIIKNNLEYKYTTTVYSPFTQNMRDIYTLRTTPVPADLEDYSIEIFVDRNGNKLENQKPFKSVLEK